MVQGRQDFESQVQLLFKSGILMIASDDASEEEWACSSGDEAQTTSPKRTRKSKRSRKAVHYFDEKIDKQFADYPGMTSFGRTRKGGDRRPRAVGKVSSIHGVYYGCC